MHTNFPVHELINKRFQELFLTKLLLDYGVGFNYISHKFYMNTLTLFLAGWPENSQKSLVEIQY